MSNCSFDEFPQNKTSSFTTALPREILLRGNWKVALAEVQYVNTFENVTRGHNTVTVAMRMKENDGKVSHSDIVINIEPGYYNSVDEILDSISLKLSEIHNFLKDVEFLKKCPLTNTVKVNHESIFKHWPASAPGKKECVVEVVSFKGRLALQLGYEPDQNIVVTAPQYPINKNFGIPFECLIYCNLVEPQLFGDSHSQVIRAVPTLDKDSRFGDVCMRTFNLRNYIPVALKEFRTIKIDIRSSTGDLMPFSWGTSSLLLHFRKD